MTYNLEKLKEIFINIQQGLANEEYKKIDGEIWYRTHRKGNTGIGKTFEDLLGKEEDNLQEPDFGNIEIKAHLDSSMITLFTKAPNLPRGINTKLRNSYGYANDKGIKVLYSTVPSGEGSSTFNERANRYFALKNNKDERAIILQICDNNKNVIDESARWTYEAIEKAVSKKYRGSTLAVVRTRKKEIDGVTYYNYYSIGIASITFETILKALDEGLLFVDLRMGAYESGKKKGQHHDHGTGFRIKFKDLLNITDYTELM